MNTDKKRGFYEARLMPSLALLGMPLPGAQLILPYGKIFKNLARLSFLQIKANRGIQPWKEIFETILATEFSDAAWTAQPKAIVSAEPELAARQALLEVRMGRDASRRSANQPVLGRRRLQLLVAEQLRAGLRQCGLTRSA